ncbi:P-loop containing nucleoside triphosphate hydrolase protein [Zychaea mexicana]|uniref:P-loop containing nucleoside triphosphate hydrolase protein n=1 Tax=Zychaea mexicana TaxID=64656 RepID=UPI0022FF2F12|nr:P-loop containing nucleoside triphosphate hydrolase protein [Zychaea mexicana]KAI9490400.1 P-loop containing nucleoside triphosphate hydrolase protein [Zychaea mexicana]
MAPLEVIGAGMSRCGTDSLRAALNILGYNTHHMFDGGPLYKNDELTEVFEEAYKHPEKHVDWDIVYNGYNAAVDCPTISFLPRLFEKYPDAKVILTKRDSESWYKSVYNTIYRIYELPPENPEEFEENVANMVKAIWLDGSFQDLQKFKDDPKTIKKRYEAHNAWMIKNIPANRLLVLDLRDGIDWDKICPFLGKPEPAVPYPHVNTTASFNEKHKVIDSSTA